MATTGAAIGAAANVAGAAAGVSSAFFVSSAAGAAAGVSSAFEADGSVERSPAGISVVTEGAASSVLVTGSLVCREARVVTSASPRRNCVYRSRDTHLSRRSELDVLLGLLLAGRDNAKDARRQPAGKLGRVLCLLLLRRSLLCWLLKLDSLGRSGRSGRGLVDRSGDRSFSGSRSLGCKDREDGQTSFPTSFRVG